MTSKASRTQCELEKSLGKKDLIMSFATNAKFGDFARFLLSARQFCPAETTDIVMFMQPDLESQFIELASKLQVTMVPVCSLWREIGSQLTLKILYRSLLLALELGASLSSKKGYAEVYRAATSNWIHPQAGRYLIYQDFLRINLTYRCVLLSDSRDVVFQDNPFPLVNPNVLNAFEQDPSMKYGGDNIDTQWFTKLMGKEVLNSIRGKQTICSGTIMGSPEVLLKYLAAMEKEILSHKLNPLDQAIHNKVVYLELPEDFVAMHSNQSGVILTLAETLDSDYEVKNNQVLINNQVVPVLHQYDRIPKLKSMIENLYPFALGKPVPVG